MWGQLLQLAGLAASGGFLATQVPELLSGADDLFGTDVMGQKRRSMILSQLAGNSAAMGGMAEASELFRQKDLNSFLHRMGTPISRSDPLGEMQLSSELEGLVQRNRQDLGRIAQREAAASSFDEHLLNLGYIDAI